MLGKRSRSLLWLCLLAVPTASARADLLYFKRGGMIQAAADVRDGVVKITTPAGESLFLSEDFIKIVPGHSPQREWPTRRDRALKEGAPARFAAAWWALENGLVPESVAMLRAAGAVDPSHQPTAKMLNVLKRLDLPCADRDVDGLSVAVGVPLEAAASRHIMLLHQLEPDQAAARLDLMERVLTTYYLILEAYGIGLKVPSERLVSVALRDQADYARFLKSQHAGAFQSSQGYYHPTFRAVVTLQQKADRADRADPSVLPPDANQRELSRRRLLADCRRRAFEDGTAVHELVHLLVNDSGLVPSSEYLPLWLHEGFAAQFEVVRGGRWAGVGRAHDIRLPDWRKARGTIEMEAFLKDAGFGRGYDSALYARSWALVYYLRKVHPEKFHTFLDLLRNPEPRTEKDRKLMIANQFRKIFGDDAAAFEKDWHAYIDRLKTPLEEFSPEADPLARRQSFSESRD